MFETMSIYSLVLVLSAALWFPPAFRYLAGAPRVSLIKSSFSLWAVTLPFAALCWYLTALWAQVNRPLVTSLAVIIGLLALFTMSFAALPLRPRPGLRRLLLIVVVLLAYAAVCWICKSMFAAATGATFDIQALLFGYLLLCPALVAALLPRRRPTATALFIVLTALLLYAVGTGATSAFWGIVPAPPDSMHSGIVISVLLVMLAALAWMIWRARRVQVVRYAAAALIVIGRDILAFVEGVGEAVATLAFGCARLILGVPRLLRNAWI